MQEKRKKCACSNYANARGLSFPLSLPLSLSPFLSPPLSLYLCCKWKNCPLSADSLKIFRIVNYNAPRREHEREKKTEKKILLWGFHLPLRYLYLLFQSLSLPLCRSLCILRFFHSVCLYVSLTDLYVS